MNTFDFAIIHFLNGFAHRSLAFDALTVLLSSNFLLDGGILVALFWWVWIEPGEKHVENREYLLFGFFASIFALCVARTLALTLPFRIRPFESPDLHFRLPYKMNPEILIGWSSFPSDHAVLFFCLAASLWIVSKRVGTVAFWYTVFVICLTRIYLGIHYPTDIIAGAVLGIGIAFLSKASWLRKGVTRPALYWQDHHPGSFSAFMFVCSFELAEQFSSVRDAAAPIYHGIKVILQTLR
jgi:undecaprenyl-diphosphatase